MSEPEHLSALAELAFGDPHRLLGRHHEDGQLVFRALAPGARSVEIICDGKRHDMEPRSDLPSIFELHLPRGGEAAPGAYRIAVDGVERHDPYAFSLTLGEIDLHLIGEGTHRQLDRVLGAHPREHQGVEGVSFSVWAPEAAGVSVAGDFNGWRADRHPMRRLDGGVWELFVPGLSAGTLYKYAVRTHEGATLMKADPLAMGMELRPQTASVIETSSYAWQDEAWMKGRLATDVARAPMSIYEVHLGSWRRGPKRSESDARPNWLSYRQLAHELVDYVADMGFTHIELMPILEHPYDGSWGYQVGSYFAPTRRYGGPDDLRYFVDRCHQRGIGVILDWVPAHFPKDAFALGRFDGTAVYEHLDPRQGEHKQWGTYVFNYGRPQVKNFLVANALYWLREFHLDGLRCDAVASMLYLDYGAEDTGHWVANPLGGRENLDAVDFVRALNDAVHEEQPGALVLAEESTAWPGVTHNAKAGGLGFDLKWNMGWMHDNLRYFGLDPIHRAFHHNLVTFGLWYAYSERFVLPLSHDEVVHMKGSLLDKMSGDVWRRFANLRCLYAHMWAHPGRKLLFMGGELAQWREWSEERALDWHLLDQRYDDGALRHRGVQSLVRDLNRLYTERPALHAADHEPRGFRWIDANNPHQSVVAYLRFADEADVVGRPPEPDEAAALDYVAVVCNFTPVPRHGQRVGVPRAAFHRELLNTDASDYGGSGMGNLGGVSSEPVPAHGFEHSLSLTLPPLSVLYLAPET